MLPGSSVISSYLARYEFSSYSVGDRVACNIFYAWEFLRPLLKGGTVYVIPDDIVFLPRSLTAFISEHQISEILFTPSLLGAVLNSAEPAVLRAQLSSLRVVWLNGEVVPTSLLNQALAVLPDAARVFNTYSISETHDVCTVELTDLSVDGMEVCPVGPPMEGVKVRVLPEGQSALASCGAGELFIGGRGLARGYLKRPDLDSERFVRWNGDRYYATGDLAEIDVSGMTTIIGRDDSMVKIRGYSVYLGAIEEALRSHCDVLDAAVFAETEDETNKRLVAYVVRSSQATWNVDARSGTSGDLRRLLERYLPLYMVPSRFVELDELPINQQTGKLDRKSLPALPERRGHVGGENTASKRRHARGAPTALRELWSETLGVDLDSLEDDWNFFDIGGHSLTGLELTLAIEQTFGIELSGAEIYEHPSISELASYLESRGRSVEYRIQGRTGQGLCPSPGDLAGWQREGHTLERSVIGPGDRGNRLPGSLPARRAAARHRTGYPVLLSGKGSCLRAGGNQATGYWIPRSFTGFTRPVHWRPDCPCCGRRLPASDGTGRRKIPGVGGRDRPDIPLRRLRQLRLSLRGGQAPHCRWDP